MQNPCARLIHLILRCCIPAIGLAAILGHAQPFSANYQQMRKATLTGDIPALKKLLDEGADLYESDHKDHTMAHYAAGAGRWDIVEFLMGRGYEPLSLTPGKKSNHAVYQRGLEILPEAAKQGRLDWIKRLVERGLGVDARGPSARDLDDPLAQALASKHIDVARYLIDAGAPFTYVSHPDNQYGGFGVVHLAIWNRNLPLLREFITKGGELDGHTDRKITPLMLTAIYDWPEGFEYLLKAGASLTPVDFDNKDATAYAQAKPALRRILMRHKIGADSDGPMTPEIELFLAVASQDLQAVTRLSKVPGLANSADKAGVPVLFHAVTSGNEKMVGLLLAAGAKANVQVADGNTPVIEAIVRKQPPIARLLIEAGADPNLGPDDEASPLEHAIKLKDFETAELLLQKGAKPDLPPGAGSRRDPPLCAAAELGNLRLVTILLGKGANIHAENGRGNGALIFACNPNGNPAVLELLVSRGLDINAVARSGEVPLPLAVAFGSPALVRKALELGAKPVNLERALGRLRPLNVRDKEILDLLKAHSAEELTEASFWNADPSREEIMAYIKKGGSPNYSAGEAPLWQALYKGDFELANFLLDHRADPNLSGYVAGSPLWALAAGGKTKDEAAQVAMATRLMQLGADANKWSRAGYPLQLAVSDGNVGLVEVLLKFGADPEPGNDYFARYGEALSPEAYQAIRKLLDKTWPKPVKL